MKISSDVADTFPLDASSVYSFDIFDTCITRPYSSPVCIFQDLYFTLKSTYPDSNIGLHSESDFLSARIQAEKRARNNILDREDITIYKIWEEFCRAEGCDLCVDVLVESELLVESLALKPVKSIRLYIDNLRKLGCKIIFISDMYLPSSFLRSILLEYNIASPTDTLYVSGDVGLLKSTGNLFRWVLKTENLLPSQLCHIGDHKRSDVKIPQKLGITGIHFSSIHLSRFEKDIVKSSNTIFKNSSRYAGISRISRMMNCSGLTENDHNFYSLLSGCFSPFLISFVSWTIENAILNGIKRLYFVSRDGEVLLKIAEKLFSNKGITFHYLYGSRQIWNQASIDRIDKDELGWIFSQHEKNSVSSVFARLGVDLDIFPRHYNFTDFEKELSSAEIDLLWDVISNDLAKVILDTSKAHASLTYTYFEQQGLCEDSSWALVDSGWRLTCQQSLKKILSRDEDVPVSGYYVGIRSDCVVDGVGKACSFLSEIREEEKWFFEQGIAPLFEEVVAISKAPALRGYKCKDGYVVPDFHSPVLSPDEILFHDAYRKVLFSYCELISEFNVVIDDQYVKAAIRNFKLFSESPCAHEVKYISFIRANVSQLHEPEQARLLAEPLSFLDLYSIGLYVLSGSAGKFVDFRRAWYLGSSVISPPHVRLIFKLLFRLKKIFKD